MSASHKPFILFVLPSSDADKYNELLPVLTREGIHDISNIDVVYDDLPAGVFEKKYHLVVIILSKSFLGSSLEQQLHGLRTSAPAILPIHWEDLDYSTSLFSDIQFAPGHNIPVENWPTRIQ